MTEKQYSCPVEVTLDLIGGKWKCVILWWLRRGSKRFGELMQLMPGVNQKVLTEQLRELEADGLIERQVFSESPPRVEYSLTAYGETLRPITELMCDWGKAHAPQFQFGVACLRGLKILVIAPELMCQRLEAELGELRGADVLTASLLVAPTAFTPAPDIVLVDLSLNKDAASLTQHLKPVDRANPIPAIALADTKTNQAVQEFQMHLTEPIEISELVAAIAQLTGTINPNSAAVAG